jgi:hypothetical protein
MYIYINVSHNVSIIVCVYECIRSDHNFMRILAV